MGEVGDSQDRAYLMLGYNIGKFGATMQTTYFSAADLDDQFLAAFDTPGTGTDPITNPAIPLAPGSYGIGSAAYVDFQFTFNPGDSYQVFLGANNAFDEEPPLVISGLPGDTTGTETDAGTYDAIGRRWYAGVRLKF